jgi:very-short-patch-repair endonuclease
MRRGHFCEAKIGVVDLVERPAYPRRTYFMAQLHNFPHQKAFRQALRTNGTAAEATLWRALKSAQLGGYKFRRQHGVGPYVLDFYCPAARLAVELDGASHADVVGQAHDTERDVYLRALSIRVLRFENKLIWSNFEGIIHAISAALVNADGANDLYHPS